MPLPPVAPPRLRLDEDHRYWSGDLRIPGLSELLKLFGFIDDSYYTEEGREVGRGVHLGTQSLDEGRQDHLQFESKAIIGRIMAYERFKREKQFKPGLIETIHQHPYGTYACRIDRYGYFGQSDIGALIELKCGSKEPWHKLQTGAQKEALGIITQPMRRFALYLRENETYELVEHKDPADGRIVVGLASAYWWRQNNGYKQ